MCQGSSVPLISSNTGAGQRLDGYKHWHWRVGETWRHLHNVASKAAMLGPAADHGTVSTNLDNLFTCQQLAMVLFLGLYLVEEMKVQRQCSHNSISAGCH